MSTVGKNIKNAMFCFFLIIWKKSPPLKWTDQNDIFLDIFCTKRRKKWKIRITLLITTPRLVSSTNFQQQPPGSSSSRQPSWPPPRKWYIPFVDPTYVSPCTGRYGDTHLPDHEARNTKHRWWCGKHSLRVSWEV